MSEVNTNKKKGDDSKFCINMLESLLGYDKNVHKLIDSIEELGCDLPKSGFFNCMYCTLYSLCILFLEKTFAMLCTENASVRI